MHVEAQRPGTLAAIVRLANPNFIAAAIILPNAVFAAAVAADSLTLLNFVHILSGALWTGIDLFMGMAVGPVLRTLQPEQRAEVIKRLVPRMTFLMPMLAGVTLPSGYLLAERLGLLHMDNGWTIAAFVIAAMLLVQGLGVLLPNQIRIFRQLIAPVPDIDRIARLGMRNTTLAGIQGLFQLAIIFVMANLRF